MGQTQAKQLKSTFKLVVQKYGGATLATPEKIKQVAKRIYELHQAGTQVVAVVSAMGETTNDLIQLAHKVSLHPQLRELDMLLTVGERISMSLMSMALNDLGCPAISFTGSQAGVLTTDSHVNAEIIDVKAFRVEEALKKKKVVILAGFQGVSPSTKEITTLGRGGSDTSAVAMAAYLKADRCEILKDVEGIFTADPKLVSNAKPITHLNYTHLLNMTQWGAKVLHHQSVQLAEQKNVPLYVGPAAYKTNHGTVITSDFQFTKQKVLAINSFSKILKIQLGHQKNLNELNQLLYQKQIGSLNLLLGSQNLFYVTAADEVLKQVISFSTHQSFFEIVSADYCCVSITCSEIIDDLTKTKLDQVFKENHINIESSFALFNGAHYFLKKNFEDSAIKSLHELII